MGKLRDELLEHISGLQEEAEPQCAAEWQSLRDDAALGAVVRRVMLEEEYSIRDIRNRSEALDWEQGDWSSEQRLLSLIADALEAEQRENK